jgi:hypothetical protein
MVTKIYYRVSTFREAGLEAKWSKTPSGKPYIVARKSGSSDKVRPGKTWFVVTADMFKRMEAVGVAEGFEEHTLLGDMLSVSVF